MKDQPVIDFYKMPEEKRLRTAATFFSWTMGALIDRMVEKFGKAALEPITEVFTQGTINNIHSARARGQAFNGIDDFLRFYLSFLYIVGLPTEVVEKMPDRVRVQYCRGLSQCPVFVQDTRACVALFNGMEKVMMRHLLPGWDAEYTRMLQKGHGACEIVFSRKATVTVVGEKE